MLTPDEILQNRYRIVKVIGQGGMGAVYQATDERLGGTVALKQTFFNDEVLGRAFEREARLLANLYHPALPRVSDHFVEGDGQFLVMSFIPGDDLAALLRRKMRPFDSRQVMTWADQILDALDYLHTQRPPVIHRDIKPQNLKVTERNQIVLLDFGLAKGAPQLLDPDGASSVFGYTLNHAPLEQIQNSGTDPRSDLYSLGATLHNLLTARTPPGSLSRAAAIVTGEADPLQAVSALNPYVSPEVGEVIHRAMALRPGDRYATAALMRRALRDAWQHLAAGRPTFGTATHVAVPQIRSAPEKDTRVIYPQEAPTRPIANPVVFGVPETVAMVPEPAARSVRTVPRIVLNLLPPFFVLALIFLAFLISLATLKSSRPLKSKPPAAPPTTVTITRGQDTSRPGLPALILPATGKLTSRNGSVTFQWSPAADAMYYRVEMATRNFSKIWVATVTSKLAHTVAFSDETGFVRIVAISAEGEQATSRWWTIEGEGADLLRSPLLSQNR